MKGVAKVARGEGNVSLIDVPEPEVTPGHVLIEVKAAGVCGTDLHFYHDEFPTTPPVIMGHEVAGIVAEVGAAVSTCQPGDQVTSETYFHTCGDCEFCRDGFPNERKSIGSGVNGAFTRYVLVPQLRFTVISLKNVQYLTDLRCWRSYHLVSKLGFSHPREWINIY